MSSDVLAFGGNVVYKVGSYWCWHALHIDDGFTLNPTKVKTVGYDFAVVMGNTSWDVKFET